MSPPTTTTTDHNSPPQPQFRQPTKRTHSPHIMDQALSVAPLRKPVHQLDMGIRSTPAVNIMHSQDTSPTAGGNKYEFESTPTPSARNSFRNSFIDPAMDPQVRLEEYDWGELEEQFGKRMEAFKAVEEGIWEEWREWGEVFKAWASTISVHDEERASKRLRTRIAYTQTSEENLEGKRQHCKFLSERSLGTRSTPKSHNFAPLSDIGRLRRLFSQLEGS